MSKLEQVEKRAEVLDPAALASNKLLRNSIDLLKGSLDMFKESSDTYSRRIYWLTWVLVALTAVLILQGFSANYGSILRDTI